MLLACTCLLFFALRYVLHVSGETRFIDDTYGDPEMGIIPSYSIANCWNNESSCPGCVLHPDASQAYDGTWHETTSNECNGQDNNAAGHSVAFNFIGTTLTIFAITVSQGPQSWQTNLSFNLDGETSYSTLFQSSLGETYEFSYAVPVFNISWLDNVLHTFTMTASQGTAASTVHFDYATYWYISGSSAAATSQSSTGASELSSTGSDISSIAHVTSSSTSDSSSAHDVSSTTNATTASIDTTSRQGTHTGAIAGGVIGGAAFVGLCLGLMIYLRGRRKQKKTEEMDGSAGDPFISHPYSMHQTSATPLYTERQSVPPASPQSNTTLEPSSDDDSLLRDVQNPHRSSTQAITPTSFMGSGVEAELRTEIATLRVQMSRLQSETERNLPPAYS